MDDEVQSGGREGVRPVADSADLGWDLDPPVEVYSSRVLRLLERRGRRHWDGHEHLFVVLDVPDWVNVLPVTPEGRVVLVRQFRAGTNSLSLEIPGGMVDPGEDPVQAARRELEEETGYVARRFVSIGFVEPNPALQTNRCHSFLALDAECRGETRWDSSERIQTLEAELTDIPRLVAEGSIRHPLVLSAFLWAFGLDEQRIRRVAAGQVDAIWHTEPAVASTGQKERGTSEDEP